MYSTAYSSRNLIKLEKWLTDFRKMYAIISFMKTHPGEAQLFNTDGRTDSDGKAYSCYS